MNNRTPLVTVIMSAYNAAPYIHKAIESVLAQTYKNIEFIVCDDGSVDSTADIVRSYSSVKLLQQPNMGQGAGRNNAAKMGTGDLFAFIDADDYWHAEKIETQLALFKKNEKVAAVYSDMRLIDSTNKHLGYNAKGRMKRGNIFNDLLGGNYMCGLSTLVVKASIFNELGGFSDHRYCQDFVFLLRLASIYDVDFVEQPLVDYLIHDHNVSNNLDVSFPELISVYNEIPVLYSLNDKQRLLVSQQEKKLHFSYAILHFRKKNFKKCRQLLKESSSSGKMILKSRVLSLLNTWPIRSIAANWV